MRKEELENRFKQLEDRINGIFVPQQQVVESCKCENTPVDLTPINTLLEELKKSITELKRRTTNIEKNLEEIKRDKE